MSRHIVDKIESPGQIIKLPPSESRHLVKVLRLNEGNLLTVFDRNGREAEAFLLKHPEGGYGVEISKVNAVENSCDKHIHMACALIRGDRFFRMIEKLTELDAATIICFESVRSTRKISPALIRRCDEIVISAVKQSGRRDFPNIHIAKGLRDALKFRPHDAFQLYFSPESETKVKDIDITQKKADDFFAVVGPEGGLDKSEIELLQNECFKALSLGKNTLRAETAAVAGLSALKFLFD